MSQLAIHGGSKACTGEWPNWPVWDDTERQALSGVLESGKWWYGDKVREFESAFAQFQDAKYGVTTTSGSTALEVALRAAGVGPGDEVIVPPYTFIATAAAVVWVGAKPVFADVQPHTLCIDPDDVERKITPRTRAIVPVHLAGHVADMDRLNEIARRHRLFMLEDACHSWGSKWRGKGTGALGNCGAFSFQVSKNIAGAEGGIILTDDKELADTCRSLTNCGRLANSPWYEHAMIGTNLRLTEFQAALLLAQLTRVEAHMETRRRNVEILNERLAGVPGIKVFHDDPRITRRTYHLYCFQLDPQQVGVPRDRFLEALAAEGVPASGGYLTPVYRNPSFQPGGDGTITSRFRPRPGSAMDYSHVSLPVVERVCQTVCWLTHSMLLADEAMIHAAADAIAKVCENVDELKPEMSVKVRARPASAKAPKPAASAAKG